VTEALSLVQCQPFHNDLPEWPSGKARDFGSRIRRFEPCLGCKPKITKFKKMKNARKMVLLKDIVIPAGTVFENIDGTRSTYVEDCYKSLIGLTDDTSGSIVYIVDKDDENINQYFREVK
jgi:hypothetical protein